MVFVRTTPPRPFDVTAVFPELAPLARPAIRLHPRPGSPSTADSSVGGPLLWPADEPWPHCESEHLDDGFPDSPAAVRLDRRRLAQQHHDPDGPSFTPEEEAARDEDVARLMKQLDAEPPPPEAPVPMLPVAQLYLRDVPVLRPPGQADLLQVLWCPYEHDLEVCKPATALFWRSAASVADVLTTPPVPYEAAWPGYVPEPCLLAPEAITEYPNVADLSPQMQAAVEDWGRWQAADVDVDSSYADFPQSFYNEYLAYAPGWKAGGWPPWGRTDPLPLHCTVCDARMAPLLTIASFEWDGGPPSWVPYEDQAAADVGRRVGHPPGVSPVQPTKVEVGSTDNMQIYVCPTSPEHPHTDLIQ